MKQILYQVYEMLNDICQKQAMTEELHDQLQDVMCHILDQTDGVEGVWHGLFHELENKG